MPDYRDSNKKGNLIVTFDVQFPRGKFEDHDELKNILSKLKAAGGKDFAKEKMYNGFRGY